MKRKTHENRYWLSVNSSGYGCWFVAWSMGYVHRWNSSGKLLKVDMSEVNDYIIERSMSSIAYFLRQAQCKHEWHKHGFGYKCDKCDYYSGMDQEINKMIEKQLNKVGASSQAYNRPPQKERLW
jgi:hypothetical protein